VLTKLITTFSLERYEIASGHAPEFAAAGWKPPWRYDAVMLQSMCGGSWSEDMAQCQKGDGRLGAHERARGQLKRINPWTG
jgi:hypothetical protein